MKQRILLFVALVCSNLLVAQFPDLHAWSVSGVSSVGFKAKSRNRGKAKTEVPPWIIPGGKKSYLFVDGSDSYIWTSSTSLTVNRVIRFKKEAIGPYNVSQSYINSRWYDSTRKIKDWGRTYHAVYSAALIQHPDLGNVSLGFLHGENKNLVAGDARNPWAKRYPNTIQTNVPINPDNKDTYSGGSPYNEGWLAYNGIISAAWVANNRATNWGQQFYSNELGPIVWPSTGYVTKQGVKCTSGLRHPSCIVYNNYVYVFYVEEGPYGDNIPEEEGRGKGIKVARAPLKDALNADSYQVYYKSRNGTETWNRSLPDGFTKDNMLNYVAVKGAKATDVLNDRPHQDIRFSVARVNNTDYFIGVEEFIDHSDGGRIKVGLRFSHDLVHWTGCVLIVKDAADWKDIHVNYPIFLSKDGWSNTNIDIDDFYIIGTDPGVNNRVNKIHIQAPAAGAMSFANGFRMQTTGEQYSILPNPNKGFFKLAYIVDTLSRVEINMYDLQGQQLRSFNGEKKPGKYVEAFDISAYPAGVYLVAIRVRNKYNIYKVMKG